MKTEYNCKAAKFDLSQLPIITLTVTKEEPNVSDIAEYRQLKNKIFTLLDMEVVMVVDVSTLKWLSAESRVAFGLSLRETESKFDHILKKSFIVIPNVVGKVIVQGVNIIARPKIPQDICRTMGSALRKAEAYCDVFLAKERKVI
ncbi:hypothetical protein [Flammeovirga agarivorans]|uniref:Uncharacterized protein n=1 Tax=Flammeovirga agarivorans TaxID=2726742 RepID=A0A7X8XY36_9BACT|nr:hypothetical protein [Flammeovirga agarivorans]NLR93738.1 hypothetical protein [Flammeovirga agarivorans]